MSRDELEPISPEEAVDIWLDQQHTERSEQTLQSYAYRLNPFVAWCDDEGITNLNDLSSRDVFRYEAARRAENLSISTLNNQIGTLKRFLEFAVRIEAVPEQLIQKVEVPTSEDHREFRSDVKLSASRAEQILDALDRFAYASRRHAIFALMWDTACRVGGLRSLDLADVFLEEDDLERLRHRDDVAEEIIDEVEPPFVFFQHRPDAAESTPLKNKTEGERPVALLSSTAEVVGDYLRINRVKRKDRDGRRPLVTSKRGETARMSTSGLRREIYIVTQPCRLGECPHDRDESECEALEHGFEARCPSSRSPHPIRTGRITNLRDMGWPPEAVGERVDATPETIRLHYDLPDKVRRMERRRTYLGDSQ